MNFGFFFFFVNKSSFNRQNIGIRSPLNNTIHRERLRWTLIYYYYHIRMECEWNMYLLFVLLAHVYWTVFTLQQNTHRCCCKYIKWQFFGRKKKERKKEKLVNWTTNECVSANSNTNTFQYHQINVLSTIFQFEFIACLFFLCIYFDLVRLYFWR